MRFLASKMNWTERAPNVHLNIFILHVNLFLLYSICCVVVQHLTEIASTCTCHAVTGSAILCFGSTWCIWSVWSVVMDQSSNDDFNNGEEDEDSIVLPNTREDEDDLYSLLVVSRNATTEEITSAYRQLSKIYHPDKHMDHKEEAVNLFAKVKKAYEVLTDPRKRAIYDEIGLKGLESDGKELVLRYQTPKEIREEYERLNREREERLLERKTNPKGNFTININCSEIFASGGDSEYDDIYSSAGPYMDITGYQMSQSVETPMTRDSTIVLSGSAYSENGRGGGNITCGLRKTISNRAWGEVEVGGSPTGIDFGFKGFTQFKQRYFMNVHGLAKSTGPGSYRPAVIVALGNQLDPHSVLTMTWRGGALSGLQTSYIRDSPSFRINLSGHLGVPHSYALMSTTFKRESYKLRTTIKGGTFGALVEYGIDKKFSNITQVGATVGVGVPIGVALRLKIIRAGQTYTLAVTLAEELIPSAVFYATVTPFIVWLVAKKLFIEPYENEKQMREKERQTEAEQSRMAEKKADAESAVMLMKETYNRIKNDETSRNGIVIVNALYGRVITGRGNPSESEVSVIDVTIPLQCIVREGKLILHDGTKSSLPGFYDPCPGDDKSLLVKYNFKNELHEVVIKDSEPLRIPKPSHRVDVNRNQQ